jgi:hypothetical protein
MSQENRVYGEEEVRSLLRRAQELQRGEECVAETGLSLDEIREVAARVGIDARYVDAAAAGIGPVESKPGRRFLFGGPSSVEVSRVLKSGELTEDEWGAIVDVLQRDFETLGKTGHHGRSRTWGTGEHDLLEAQVVVQSRENVSAIRVTRRFEGLLALSTIIGSVAVLAGTPIALSILGSILDFPIAAGLLVAAGGVSGLALGVRSLYGRFTRNQQRRLSELVTRIEALTRRDAAQVAPRTDAWSGLAEAAPEGLEAVRPRAAERDRAR